MNQTSDVFERLHEIFDQSRSSVMAVDMLPDDIWTWTDDLPVFSPERAAYRQKIMDNRYRRALALGDGADKETILRILSGHDEPPLTGSLDPAVALFAAFPQAIYRPIPLAAPWLALKHTVCGTGVCTKSFIGVRLRMRPEAEKVFEKVARRFEGSDLGLCHPVLNDLLGYRESIEPAGVDCNIAYRHLAEAAYPVDWNDESFRALAEPTADAERLLAEQRFRQWGCLLVLSPNSD